MFESDFMGYLKIISFRCQQREQETGPEILTCKVKKEKRLENSMSKKYKQLAREIIEKAGGKDNISDVCHCQTRLRFKLKDEAKASDQALKDMDEVAGVIHNAGVYQVVIGTYVADAFEETAIAADLASKKGQTSEQPEEKKNFGNMVIEFVASVFQPIIPALSGAGMVKAVLALLVVFHIITNDSQTYILLNMCTDAIFYFLPVLLAYTSANRLKCNPILAASTALIMMHPTWTGLVAAGDPVRFFELMRFQLVSYGSRVIPIILIIFVQSCLERWLNKEIPKSVNLVYWRLYSSCRSGWHRVAQPGCQGLFCCCHQLAVL